MPSVADLVEEPRRRHLAGEDALAEGSRLASVGSVGLRAFGPVRVAATVEDGDTYDFELRVAGNDLRWSCRCAEAGEATSADTASRWPG